MDTEQFQELTVGLIRLHNDQALAENQREEARAERETRRAYEQARRHVSEQSVRRKPDWSGK